MARPRRLIAGATYLVTRRCTDRQFFLLPRKQILDLLWYDLAYAAERYGIEVHAAVFMANHLHLVATDPRRNLSRFMRWFCQNTSAALNRLYGRTGLGTIWEPDRRYTSIRQLDPGAVERALRYVLMNPVAAGLVPTAAAWRDAVTLPEHFGRTRELRRPGHYFRQKGTRALPERVRLRLTCPKQLREQYPTDDDYRAAMARLLEEAEGERERQFAQEGRRFMGLAKILKQQPTDTPQAKPEAYTPLRWPFMCSDPSDRQVFEQDHRSWEHRTCAAYELFRDPKTRPEARFPRDSYKWVEDLGAPVEDEVPPDG
ncbi:MAG: transposase [Planctomycetota bacterium]